MKDFEENYESVLFSPVLESLPSKVCEKFAHATQFSSTGYYSSGLDMDYVELPFGLYGTIVPHRSQISSRGK